MSDLIKQLTADIVTAYVGNNDAKAHELRDLIDSTYKALIDASGHGQLAHAHPHDHHDHRAHDYRHQPAVDPRKSVFKDRIICLEDGMAFTTLKRHLSSAHGMTIAEYKQKWGLPFDYPVVASVYANARSKLAKASGLGRK